VPVLPGGAVLRALRDFRPDIVVVSLPFLLSRATWRAARDEGYPLVGITSMMPEWFYYNLGSLRPLASLLNTPLWHLITGYYNRCDHVVGVTTTALGLLRRHGLSRPATVISNGIPLAVFHPRPPDRALGAQLGLPAKPTVLYTGRLDAEKCMDVWVRAIPFVRQQVDAHFVIGGDGDQRRRLAALVAALGIADAVTFVGFRPEAEYPAMFSLADAFAISSPAELQSLVTLEAAASGLPIVAARAGALPELVADGENGRLFVPGCPTDLAAALVDVLRDPDRRRAMGAQSRRIAEAHDFDRSLDLYEQVFRRVALKASPSTDTSERCPAIPGLRRSAG
jgi:1,2-diacylglycerol 3-alpha-glucosyltransferase